MALAIGNNQQRFTFRMIGASQRSERIRITAEWVTAQFEKFYDEFLEEFNPSYPILLVDVYEPPEPFGAPKVLPTTIILNPEGFPVKTYLGPVTREAIESFIDSK